ncbi:MAG: hypothetical protein PHE86_00945 [Candidatus Marinimicrobia bacterium]|nr:hypothetical protein [Candidatus Neomarinimicrobiota bacterium]MDD5582879.1 hypothetical protein [Candidatus Neomarinimicrobiota bacterium]
MNFRSRPAYPLNTSTKDALKHIIKGIPALVKLLFRLIKSRKTSLSIKLWIAGTAIYLVSPLNISIKRFKRYPLKIINYIDDFTIILVVIQKILETCPYDLLEENWDYKIPILEWKDMIYKIRTDIQTAIH